MTIIYYIIKIIQNKLVGEVIIEPKNGLVNTGLQAEIIKETDSVKTGQTMLKNR